MNYQEIVNRIQDITNQHKMLADFGYGDLSDLKVRFENTSGDSAVQADYPYLFLNPGVHQRNQGMVTYNFNMIVMDMARGEVSDQPYNNMLAIQSQCQQYIDDVIAYLYNGYTDNPDVIYSGVTYTPFNERFQDDVAGMTATLTVQVAKPINNCITPFPSEVPPAPEPISIIVTVTEASNEACNNGSVVFQVSGGILPQILFFPGGQTFNITNPNGTSINIPNLTEDNYAWLLGEDWGNNGTTHSGNFDITCIPV